jgi:predicted alpha/beta-hydrolase family hydrolase
VHELAAGLPLVVGGRSAGARVACRTAESVGAAAVVCIAFPLHPPGRPDKSRIDELLTPDLPVLVLQGERDAFGTPTEIADALAAARRSTPGAAAPDTAGADATPTAGRAGIRVTAVPHADHSLKTRAGSPVDTAAVAALLTAAVADFVRDLR